MTEFVALEFTLATAVADSATVAPAYPSGSVQADFTGVNAAAVSYLLLNDNDRYTEAADDFDISFGGSTITFTNKTGVTWPAGTKITAGLAKNADVADVTTLEGTLTGTIDGTIADVAAVATAGGNTYADSAINTAITSINLQHKELQAVLNNAVAALNAMNARLAAAGIEGFS